MGRHSEPGRHGKMVASLLLVLAVSIGAALTAGNWSRTSAARPATLTVAASEVTLVAPHIAPVKKVAVARKMVGTKKYAAPSSRKITLHSVRKHTVKRHVHRQRHHCHHRHHLHRGRHHA